MQSLKYFAPVGLIILFVLMGVALTAEGQSTFKGPTRQAATFDNFTFFSATTTSATSTNTTDGGGYLLTAGAKKLVWYFSRGGATGANTGSSKFEVECSPDGTNWYDFNRLFLTDTAQTASSTIWITAATSTVVASMDLEDHACYAVRAQVVEVTDGEHTAKAYAEF